MSVARFIVPFLLLSAIVPVAAEALQDGIQAVQRKDYPAALRTLEPLARAGSAQAQLQLGLLYFHGHGVRESDPEATRWFERAARQGLAEAQYHLGNMYAYGLESAPAGSDGQRLAAQWYFEAARQGHVQAQYSLGILFLTGSGVVQDVPEAERWMARAAAAGHVDAAAYLKGKTP